MPFTNNMVWRSGPTKCWAWSSIHIVWYPASVFAENWLYCMGLLELCGYMYIKKKNVNFTNCPRTFGWRCIKWSAFHLSVCLSVCTSKWVCRARRTRDPLIYSDLIVRWLNLYKCNLYSTYDCLNFLNIAL